MHGDTTMPLTSTAGSHWHVRLTDRADIVFPLRDYFRRLGLPAEVEGPTAVHFRTAVPADEIEAFVDSWATINEIELDLKEVRAGSPLLIPKPSGSTPPRLGELLIQKGYITEEQLTFALTEARVTNDLVGVVLVRDGLIYEEELARTLSEQLSIPYISIMRIGVNERAARLLPADVGEAAAAIPVRTRGKSVQVAFADPTDPHALALVRRHLPMIDVAVAELTDIRLAWRQIAKLSAGFTLPDLTVDPESATTLL